MIAPNKCTKSIKGSNQVIRNVNFIIQQFLVTCVKLEAIEVSLYRELAYEKQSMTKPLSLLDQVGKKDT